MLRVTLGAATPLDLEPVAHALRAGGVAVIPTDTIYGVSARFDRPSALRRLVALKGRHTAAAPFLVLIAELGWLSQLTTSPPSRAVSDLLWPGAVTALLPARSGLLPQLIGPRGTVAVRYPESPRLLRLLQAVSVPLVSTSANRSGEPPLLLPDRIARELGAGIDVLADAGDLGAGVPSTLVDLTQMPPVVLRQGAVRIDLEALGRATGHQPGGSA
jgi:L-threonylcarbamoyladenylate synthase